jgi:hypothetical protein
MHVPFLHCFEAQSGFSPHGLPDGHDGAHAGAAHFPAVQTSEPQSPGAPQGWPALHFIGPFAHPGGWHV